MTSVTGRRPVEAAGQAGPTILDQRIAGRIAWRKEDIAPGEWNVAITPDARSELDLMADAFANFEGPVEDLSPDAFDWPATTEIMVEVQRRLNFGIGFAVLDRLPVELWGEQASRAVSWLLSTLLAPPIMQKWEGARVYDVRDTGANLQYGVRRSITNLPQELHTDGSFLKQTPDYLALFCLRQADAGGVSRVASLCTVHNVLREAAPWHLARLYRPLWWDRQAEHGKDEQAANWLPVFESDGETLSVRYYDDYIRNGYRLMDAALGDETSTALEAMKAIIESPENSVEFRLQPGQILFGQNRLLAHGRTAFQDNEDKDLGRHLLRFWLRSSGGIALEAETAPVD